MSAREDIVVDYSPIVGDAANRAASIAEGLSHQSDLSGGTS
jgi:hypothetical protein